MICERTIIRVSIAGVKLESKIGMIRPAVRMKKAVIAPRTIVTSSRSVEAMRKASLNFPCSICSVKIGTKAGCRAASAKSARIRFGTWKAIVKADIASEMPKYLAATTSRARPATRDAAVAIEKNAVDLASLPGPAFFAGFVSVSGFDQCFGEGRSDAALLSHVAPGGPELRRRLDGFRFGDRFRDSEPESAPVPVFPLPEPFPGAPDCSLIRFRASSARFAAASNASSPESSVGFIWGSEGCSKVATYIVGDRL